MSIIIFLQCWNIIVAYRVVQKTERKLKFYSPTLRYQCWTINHVQIIDYLSARMRWINFSVQFFNMIQWITESVERLWNGCKDQRYLFVRDNNGYLTYTNNCCILNCEAWVLSAWLSLHSPNQRLKWNPKISYNFFKKWSNFSRWNSNIRKTKFSLFFTFLCHLISINVGFFLLFWFDFRFGFVYFISCNNYFPHSRNSQKWLYNAQ